MYLCLGLTALFAARTLCLDEGVLPPEPWEARLPSEVRQPTAVAVALDSEGGLREVRPASLMHGSADPDERTETGREANELQRRKQQRIMRKATPLTALAKGQDGSVAATEHIMSAAGQDCPVHAFSVKTRKGCKFAMEAINSFGQEILVMEPDDDIQSPHFSKEKPAGCFLECATPSRCTTRFNDGGSKNATNDPRIRRYCQGYFTHTRGACRQALTGERKVLSHGTFSLLDRCKTECLTGPLHAEWCEGFEVSDPFENKCMFFKEISEIGDGKGDARCYKRIPSSH